MGYRQFRNLEASLIDFLTDALADDGWNNIRVEKNFAEVYKPNRTFPCFLVEVGDVNPMPTLEVGNYKHIQYFNISIRIYATSNSLREDLANWLFDILESTIIDYYEYTIQSGDVESKVLAGSVIITQFTKHARELANTTNVSTEDKFRHIISFKAKLS
jgi:hypothetical protein